jgi:hypothetical protein
LAGRKGWIKAAVVAFAGAMLSATPAVGDVALGCGSVVTESTTLTTDLFCAGDGLIVTAPGITVDLGGHLIRGPGSDRNSTERGVVAAAPGATVRNGRIQDFGVGVRLAAGVTEVTGLTLVDNTVGVSIASGRNRVRGNAFTGNGGAVVMSGDVNLVEGNALHRNGAGMFVAGFSNHIAANGIVGDDGHDFGITVFGVQTRVTGNRVSHYRAGISMAGTGDISGNVAFSNVDGIAVSGSATVAGNTALLNSDDGIEVTGAARVQGNTVARNGDLGIEASGQVTDGGGNRAFGNGNPRQCEGVVCG